MVEPKWDLDKVLGYLASGQLTSGVSKYHLLMKSIFLLGIALGYRISEFQALRRGSRDLVFSRGLLSVTIMPNASFLAKNEMSVFRRKPMVVKAFFNSDGTRNPLCPVKALHSYVKATDHFKRSALFINPVSGAPCNRGSITYHLRTLIGLAQPGVYSKFHDLRRLSSWKAFFARMSVSSMRYRGFWKSNSALARRYLVGTRPSSRACVALGAVCH